MRWVFYAIVGVNLAYLCWQWVAGAGPKPESSRPRAPIEGVENILLLSEARDRAQKIDYSDIATAARDAMTAASAARQAGSAAATEDAGGQAGAMSAPLCAAFGPFLNAADGERLARFMDELGVESELVAERKELDPRYWAYIEPQANLQQAMMLLSRLRTANVAAYLIGEGEMKNGLSLGVYEHSEDALKLQQLVGQMAQVEVKPSGESYDEFWVLVARESGAVLGDNNVKKIIEFLPTVKQKQKNCKAVASPE